MSRRASRRALAAIRRRAAALAATTLLGGAAMPAAAAPLNVTILGSGSPVPSNVRFSQSTLVEAGQDKLLIDAGRGATIRLSQLGIALRDVTATFLTHLHSDHLDGLTDLWSASTAPERRGSAPRPLRRRTAACADLPHGSQTS
ncbi:MAG: hypothetical protein NVSMB34_02440 [Variovorax sp.]